jgi:hypothetical protein
MRQVHPMTRINVAVIWMAVSAVATPVWSQIDPGAPKKTVVSPMQASLGRVTCPGDPPGNLASLDCFYTTAMRVDRFLGESVTDQAVLGATFFGLVAQVRKSPPEWGRDWEGFGRRVGTRYGQNVAKGATAFAVGALMQVDPRLVSYAADPLIDRTRRTGGAWTRVGHAVMDWATVRRSARDGGGRRLPNLPLFAGATVSGLAGNLWYPDRLTTSSQTAKRIGGSLGTALFASFYNEFEPELGRVLGRLVRRGADAQRRPAVQKGARK